MSKAQSGLVLLVVAIVMNIAGRMLLGSSQGSQDVSMAGFLAVLMFASVVTGLFGLFRLITGLLTKQ